MSIAEKLTTIAENQEKVYEAGAAVAQKKPYLDTSTAEHHEYLFSGNRWLDQLDKFDFSNITQAAYMFQGCTEMITCPAIDTSKTTRMHQFFYNCYNLVEIKGVDFSSIPNADHAKNAFYNCTKLQKLTINGVIPYSMSFSYSRVLNKESIEGVVNALSDTATGQTITFSQLAVNATFTTDELTALEATKPNWSFAYA